MDDTHQG